MIVSVYQVVGAAFPFLLLFPGGGGGVAATAPAVVSKAVKNPRTFMAALLVAKKQRVVLEK